MSTLDVDLDALERHRSRVQAMVSDLYSVSNAITTLRTPQPIYGVFLFPLLQPVMDAISSGAERAVLTLINAGGRLDSGLFQAKKNYSDSDEELGQVIREVDSTLTQEIEHGATPLT
jgi:hypothetical protein